MVTGARRRMVVTLSRSADTTAEKIHRVVMRGQVLPFVMR